MGVAIHYRGQLATIQDARALVATAFREAKRYGWQTRELAPFGAVVLPVEKCDPLEFQPDEKLVVDSFVKTQFAGPDVHIQVVQFLRSLAGHFAEWDVEDEGEFYEFGDRKLLQQHMEAFDKALADHLKDNPGSRGSVRLPSGRWVDVIE
jgi:hypothetical protein